MGSGKGKWEEKAERLTTKTHTVRTKNQGGAVAGLTSPCSDANLAVCQPLVGMRKMKTSQVTIQGGLHSLPS